MKNGKFLALIATGAAIIGILSSLIIVIKSPSAVDLVKMAAPVTQTSAVVTIADD